MAIHSARAVLAAADTAGLSSRSTTPATADRAASVLVDPKKCTTKKIISYTRQKQDMNTKRYSCMVTSLPMAYRLYNPLRLLLVYDIFVSALNYQKE